MELGFLSFKKVQAYDMILSMCCMSVRP